MGLFSGRVEARAESVDDSQSESVRSQSILGESKSEAGWKDPGPPPDGGVLAWTQVL
ncbi:hypothetical protein CH063_14808, partial [Colletotrichum higginsianum]